MALPTQYLTSQKNLGAILDAIRSAQAPDKFTLTFLESLEFKSSSDRLVIGVLKSLGFLDDGGRPTQRYFTYLDQTQSERVMAEGIREAYEDLFRVNVNAQQMSKQELINKFKTLSQGKITDSVLDKMAMTFTALAKHANFAATSPPRELDDTETGIGDSDDEGSGSDQLADTPGLRVDGLVYSIQIVLPESRDKAVYDALFRSLRQHLR